MTIAFWTAIGGAVLGFATLLISMLERRKSYEDGQVAQADKEALATAIVESNVNKAIMAAPDTRAEVIDRLQKGTF